MGDLDLLILQIRHYWLVVSRGEKQKNILFSALPLDVYTSAILRLPFALPILFVYRLYRVSIGRNFFYKKDSITSCQLIFIYYFCIEFLQN